MPRFSTCLFDLDGTLIDSEALIMSSFRHTMRTHLGTVPPEGEWRAGFGTPLRPQLAKFATGDDQVAAMTATYRAHNLEHHDRLVRVFAGIRPVVEALHAQGVRLAIVTSKNRTATDRGLRHCALAAFFDVRVTSDDVREHKPKPTPVLEALARLETSADRTVFVGDSPADCLSGRAAGVRTAAALWGPFGREALEPHHPDHWLEAPDDILRLAAAEAPAGA
jgi:pyrophosphatase PpaX